MQNVLDAKEVIIRALLQQKEIFGDELFADIELSKIKFGTTEIVSDKLQEETPVFTAEKKEENYIEVQSLDEFNRKISSCMKCELGRTRKNFVFGVGNPKADLMLIGEAPGAEEDLQGIPFVGRAGKLLTDILKAINFSRDEVYIANILKCRPPNNRDPLPVERDTCFPYLDKQIELIQPKVILCLGRIAGNTLLGKNEPMSLLRGGNIFKYHNIPVMVTYHPAALLRNPNWKRGCWEDVQAVRKLYDELTQK
jgi:DNA polymerase